MWLNGQVRVGLGLHISTVMRLRSPDVGEIPDVEEKGYRFLRRRGFSDGDRLLCLEMQMVRRDDGLRGGRRWRRSATKGSAGRRAVWLDVVIGSAARAQGFHSPADRRRHVFCIAKRCRNAAERFIVEPVGSCVSSGNAAQTCKRRRAKKSRRFSERTICQPRRRTLHLRQTRQRAREKLGSAAESNLRHAPESGKRAAHRQARRRNFAGCVSLSCPGSAVVSWVAPNRPLPTARGGVHTRQHHQHHHHNHLRMWSRGFALRSPPPPPPPYGRIPDRSSLKMHLMQQRVSAKTFGPKQRTPTQKRLGMTRTRQGRAKLGFPRMQKGSTVEKSWGF